MESRTTHLDTSAVDALLRQTGGGGSTITFAGLPGSTEMPNHIRLYEDAELISFLEIPADAVVDTQQAPGGGLAFVRCRRDTRIRVGAVATMNAEVVFTPLETQGPVEMIPLDDTSPTTPRLPAPKPPSICHMSVKFRAFFRWVIGPDGLPHLAPMAIPLFVLDCEH